MKIHFNYILFITALLSSTSLSTSAEEKYISDNIPTYTRRGPGIEYPLSGTLTAGDKIHAFETSRDGKFTRIQNEQGQSSWIETMLLQHNPSVKLRVPELEQQIVLLQNRLNELQNAGSNRITDLRKKLAEIELAAKNLTAHNQRLKTQLTNQKKELKTVKDILDQKRHNLMLDWFLYGGIVAGCGLLLGLLIPFTFSSRKKHSNWIK